MPRRDEIGTRYLLGLRAKSHTMRWAGTRSLATSGPRSLRGEPDGAERRDAEEGRGRKAVAGLAGRLDRAQGADAAAAVVVRVGVHDLAPATRMRQGPPVVLVRDAGEVDHTGQRRAVRGVAQEGHHVARDVVRVDPAEPLRVGVSGPQRARAGVGPVEVADQPLEADMVVVLCLVQQPPVERPLFGPLRALAELLAHEQQLLTRMR